MRHRGVHVGNFHLVEREGGEPFTDEDEDILVLFASQGPRPGRPLHLHATGGRRGGRSRRRPGPAGAP